MPSKPMSVSNTRFKPRRDFELSLQAIFASDPLTLNNLLVQMPLFLWSLRDEAWEQAAQLIIAAQQNELITQQQYDAIKQAAHDAHTPMVLP